MEGRTHAARRRTARAGSLALRRLAPLACGGRAHAAPAVARWPGRGAPIRRAAGPSLYRWAWAAQRAATGPVPGPSLTDRWSRKPAAPRFGFYPVRCARRQNGGELRELSQPCTERLRSSRSRGSSGGPAAAPRARLPPFSPPLLAPLGPRAQCAPGCPDPPWYAALAVPLAGAVLFAPLRPSGPPWRAGRWALGARRPVLGPPGPRRAHSRAAALARACAALVGGSGSPRAGRRWRPPCAPPLLGGRGCPLRAAAGLKAVPPPVCRPRPPLRGASALLWRAVARRECRQKVIGWTAPTGPG